MKKITIEDAFKIREEARANKNDKIYYSVIANILLGMYDTLKEDAQAIAEDDISVLTNGIPSSE